MILFNSCSIRLVILMTAVSGLFACSNSNSAPENKATAQPEPLMPGLVVTPATDTPVKAATIVTPKPVPASMKKTAILDNKISFLLPVPFRPMSLKEYQVKYGMPSMESNMFVYTDNELEANFLIHYTDEPIDSSGMDGLAQELLSELKLISHYRFIKSGPVKAGNRILQSMEFEVETLDAKSVSIFYFTIVDGKLLKGNFNFPATQRNKWQEKAGQTMQSIYIN